MAKNRACRMRTCTDLMEQELVQVAKQMNLGRSAPVAASGLRLSYIETFDADVGIMKIRYFR